MTVTRRQVVSHAASAAAGAVVAVVIIISFQRAFLPGGPPAPTACPAGSEFSRTLEAGRYVGWRACITFLPGGADASLWNVTADETPTPGNPTPENESVLRIVYRFNVDTLDGTYIHQNTSYIDGHEPVFWNTALTNIGGFAGETAQFELLIVGLLYYGDDLAVVKEVRFYLGKHEPPIYDPSNEPHRIVSDILSITFLPPPQPVP